MEVMMGLIDELKKFLAEIVQGLGLISTEFVKLMRAFIDFVFVLFGVPLYIFGKGFSLFFWLIMIVTLSISVILIIYLFTTTILVIPMHIAKYLKGKLRIAVVAEQSNISKEPPDSSSSPSGSSQTPNSNI